MIRAAVPHDIPHIIRICKEAHELSVSKGVPLDEGILKKNIQICILSAEHLVNVVETAGAIEGVFIGVTNQLWYSRKKQAADLFFYVTEKGKGWGSSLLRRYIQWARMNRGVVEINLGVMSGIGDMDRTKKLYERLGAVKVGDSYVLPKEK
jgi:GNAT superfamily N-acetyltransferase|tara:strand:+ start:19 stop:471 length:453 start_codon:yes stop_codon:yes gene_type:complete